MKIDRDTVDRAFGTFATVLQEHAAAELAEFEAQIALDDAVTGVITRGEIGACSNERERKANLALLTNLETEAHRRAKRALMGITSKLEAARNRVRYVELLMKLETLQDGREPPL